MTLITQTDDYDLWMDQVDRPYLFTSPFVGEDFALLLIVATPNITNDERAAVSQEIVRQGCHYAVCTGDQCSLWDDSIDFAFLATDKDFSPRTERFIMTTWHDEEPLDEVVHSFRWNTIFDNFVPQHYLVLILGNETKTVKMVRTVLGKLF
ncbi:MAG: hypothetical protein U0798_14125 [Gemmataceae bacterium]